ncbi:MAG TPA: benzoate-CoA ligase family protein, partial [Acidimicrobiaceae bacterium]|nr:benzoate-CoA ligase family protein [Acidimicrobiaceae bacterium]
MAAPSARNRQTANAVVRFVVEPALRSPDAVAVTDAPTGATATRAQVAAGVRAAAAALTARGVQAEQRVMLCCADTTAFLWWFWGAMWIGAVPVPVSTMLTAADYAFLLDDSRAVGLVFSPAFAATAGAAAAEGSRRFLRWSLSDDDAGEPGAGELGAGAAAPEVFDASEDDVAFWLYTSGTTGFPKGAMHRHVDMGFCTDRYAVPVLSMGEDDVVYSVAKLFFAYGLGNAGYFPPGTGARAVLNPGRPTPEDIAAHVVAHRPTLYFGVPTSYAQLLAAEPAPDTFESVRLAVSAGEPLPAGVARRFRDRFGVEVLDGFGTTELCHVAITNRPGASVPGTSGTVLDGYEVSLRDEHGNE